MAGNPVQLGLGLAREDYPVHCEKTTWQYSEKQEQNNDETQREPEV